MGVQAHAVLTDPQALLVGVGGGGEAGKSLILSCVRPKNALPSVGIEIASHFSLIGIRAHKKSASLPALLPARKPHKLSLHHGKCAGGRRSSIVTMSATSEVGISVSSDKRPAGDDGCVAASLDYKEAAVALEQIFKGSRSLDEREDQESSSLANSSSGSQKPRRRKDLTMRISLKRKRLEMIRSSGRPKPVGLSAGFASILWSDEANELVREYGGVFNLMSQNWFRLGHKLLTAKEEHWLASLMRPARALEKLKQKLQQLLRREPLEEEWARASKVELGELRRHVAVHQAARNKFVQHNWRLVLHQARKYHRAGSSLTVSDLCQEGVKGLMAAVERFEPRKGYRFSTYAVFWIRNAVLRAQARAGYPVRAPFNFAEVRMHIKKVRGEMEEERRGGAVAEEEVMERAGVEKARYLAVMRAGRQRVRSLHRRDRVTGIELIENLPDLTDHQPPLLGADPTLRLGLDDVLDSLKPKESLVLRQRFGLDGKGERALGEIGRNLRMSREMARRYEARALLKLKHPARLAFLRPFLSNPT